MYLCTSPLIYLSLSCSLGEDLNAGGERLKQMMNRLDVSYLKNLRNIVQWLIEWICSLYKEPLNAWKDLSNFSTRINDDGPKKRLLWSCEIYNLSPSSSFLQDESGELDRNIETLDLKQTEMTGSRLWLTYVNIVFRIKDFFQLDSMHISTWIHSLSA